MAHEDTEGQEGEGKKGLGGGTLIFKMHLKMEKVWNTSATHLWSDPGEDDYKKRDKNK